MADLPENRFINDSQDPFPLWLWFFIVVAVGAVVWGTASWWMEERNVAIGDKPFLQVTNREFSRFLWQFPEYMRANYPAKTGYLPAFQEGDGINMVPEEADSWVQAPPEVLFLYHTWNRLLAQQYFPTPIPKNEFIEFLDQTKIWHPRYWKAAPVAYRSFIASLPTLTAESLDEVPMSDLPLAVRASFQGWKNFYKEGKEIEAVSPTYTEMNAFLRTAPAYSRNYWYNIVKGKMPDYLKSFDDGAAKDGAVPRDQLTPFLKVAFYNFTKNPLGAGG